MAETDTHASDQKSGDYKENSLTLWGSVSLGTGVMIGAGIFALTGQVAELAKEGFVWAFALAFVVASFSAYSYVKMASAYPSAGGIAMILKKLYGKTTWTGYFALLMFFSMVINESLVARTFGTYTLQVLPLDNAQFWVPALGVGLLAFAFVINILSNHFIERFSFFMAFVKAAGLIALAVGGLYASGLSFESVSANPVKTESGLDFIGAVALALLAYKGFTTITNSGGEIKDPHKNVGRSIIISLVICVLLYLLVTLAVGANLSIEEIVKAKDYSLAEAAKPAYGQMGVWITVAFAIVATVSGVIASVFAVSRMLAMLTDMNLAPYRSFGIPGSTQRHTLVYTIIIAMLLTVFFDLSRIAALGAIFYIIMDMAIHYGVWKNMKDEVKAQSWILITAFALDAILLAALLGVKFQTDPTVVWISLAGLLIILGAEKLYMNRQT